MSLHKMRLFIIPRWSGRQEGEWYPWLKKELLSIQDTDFEVVEILDMPNPDTPVIEEWVSAIAESVGADPEELERTILVGHSVGCQAILRFLAGLPVGLRIHGMLGVAAWWTVDEPWQPVLPWIEEPLDTDRARAATEKFVVLISDDDPVTSDETSNKLRWEEHLNARVLIIPDSYHFMLQKEPIVLNTLIENFL